MSKEILSKYPTLCSHDFQKSLTNEVQLACNLQPGTVHRVSQFGKICNKCTQIIQDSVSAQSDCIVCSDTILTYLKERELCQHEIRESDEIHLKCLNDASSAHDLPLPSRICRKCCDKVRAAFMNSKTCKICEGRQGEVLKDLQKVFISPSYSHIKNVIAILTAANADPELFKNQIESACKAQPRVQRKENGIVTSKLVEEYNAGDRQDAHISKRYKLYPKCRKHRSNFISVCNACLVALLNLDCCPYGCPEQGKAEGKVKKETNVKYYETGFLSLFPQLSKQSYYLELFVLRLIEEKARLDRWEVSIRRLQPKSNNQEKFVDNFALYSASVAVSRNDFFVCGGVKGRRVEQMKPTADAYVLSVSAVRKDFEIIVIPPMLVARSGHSLVYHQSRKMVFAIGGYTRQGGFIKETEVYSIDNQKWFKLGDLNVQRSKVTACLYKDSIYVFGGLTSNPKIYEVQAEKFNYDNQKWEELRYSGYDTPFITNSTPSTSLLPFQNKQNLVFFGGCDINTKTNIIQKLIIGEKQFHIDYKNPYLQYARDRCTLGLINDDTLVCFGGGPEYESFLVIDVVKLKPNDSEVQMMYVNDQVQLGSYRQVARQDSEKFYSRIKDQLKHMGLLSQDEKELVKQQGLVSPQNCLLLEKIWFSLGKNYVWLPL